VSDSRTLVGLGVSPGIAIGKPVIVENRPLPVMRVPLSPVQIDPEVARLRKAAKSAAKHLLDLAREAAKTVGAEYASIFEAHRLMLEDPALLDEVERLIRGEAVNAEWAVAETAEALVGRFRDLPDEDLALRATDLDDVSRIVTQRFKIFRDFRRRTLRVVQLVAFRQVNPGRLHKTDSQKI